MRPTVTVSYAQSLDGRIATVTGESKWISGDETLEFAHILRRDSDAVLVGIGTILTDDPELSCRLPGNPPSPLRIVLDSRLRIQRESKICRTITDYPTVVFTGTDTDTEKRSRLEASGIRVFPVRRPSPSGGLDLEAVLDKLGGIGVTSLFVEGGSRVITSFLRHGLVDRLIVVCAPVVIGEGKSAIGDLGVKALTEAIRGKTRGVRRAGDDIIWEVDLRASSKMGTGLEKSKSAGGETARAVFFTAPKRVEVREVPLKPGDSRIPVESRCIGISHGTELHFYRGSFVRGRSEDAVEGMDEVLDYPLRYGYMNSGDASYPDGTVRRVFAFYPHQDRFYADPDSLIGIDDTELSYEDIALYPSMETAYTIALDTAPLPGEEVVIFGLGMIGLLTAEILSLNRSIRLTAVEPRGERSARGRTLGIRCLDSLPIDGSADKVVDTVGTEETLAAAMRCLRHEGTLVEAAWTGERVTGVELGKDFHRKRLVIKASQVSHIPGSLLARWDGKRRSSSVIEMLKVIRPSKYITGRYPLMDAAEAFERIDREEEDDFQVVLLP